MKILSICLVILCGTFATETADASSSFDGSWNLSFVTRRGACDPTYDFTVNINDGMITHPNLVKFKGRVARSGAVTASVTSRINMRRDQESCRQRPGAEPGKATLAHRYVPEFGAHSEHSRSAMPADLASIFRTR